VDTNSTKHSTAQKEAVARRAISARCWKKWGEPQAAKGREVGLETKRQKTKVDEEGWGVFFSHQNLLSDQRRSTGWKGPLAQDAWFFVVIFFELFLVSTLLTLKEAVYTWGERKHFLFSF
jgi:hypothetical protein